MSAPAPSTAAAAESSLYNKVTIRLLPFLLLCYVFAYLDRTNIGFAKLQMQEEMPHLTDSVFGLGAGVFFIAYACLEIPSNLLMHRIGARRTVTRIMILWALASMAMLFVRGPVSFYVLRVILGIFEAGFAPAILLYFTYWFPAKRLAGVMGIFALAGPIGSILGSTTSGLIIGLMHHTAGLSGWQWMFLIQGMPALILGILFWYVIPDRPRHANWLGAAEVQLLEDNLATTSEAHTDSKFVDVLKNPLVYVMAVAYFGIMCGIYAVSFWLPTILHASGIDNPIVLGFVNAVPYLITIPIVLIVCWSSDRIRERFWHAVIPAVLGAVGLVGAVYGSAIFALSFTALCVAVCMLQSAYAVFWAVPTETFGGTGAAGGIAFINTIGILGGFVAPTIMGFVQDATGSSNGGLMTMVVLVLISAAALVVLKLTLWKKKPQVV